jgi:hypothetical protein
LLKRKKKGSNSQVLQISSRKRDVSDDLDLAIACLRDLDGVAQVTDATVDLDPVMQELLEGGDVEDLIVDWLRGVDGKLFL